MAAMHRGPARVTAGLALSLLLHGAVLLAWQGLRVAPAIDTAPRPLSVWLRPPPPPPAPVADTPPAPAKPARSRTPRAATARPAPAPVIALPARRETEAPPDGLTVAPPAEPATPRFDPDAARKLAGRLANEPDPERAKTAVGQIPPKELATETKAARAIAQARRRDCKDGLPGGLLGPLLLLLDKKDSGCKW